VTWIPEIVIKFEGLLEATEARFPLHVVEGSSYWKSCCLLGSEVGWFVTLVISVANELAL
jgi:hypothetical protein